MDLAELILFAALAGGAGIFTHVSTNLVPSYAMTREPSTASWRAGETSNTQSRFPTYSVSFARGESMDFETDENKVGVLLAAGTPPDVGIPLANFNW